MLARWAAAVWRRLPKKFRRWGVLLTEARFTVTAGAVITNDQGQILLLQHRFRPGGGWGIPGGFIKSDEQPLDALQRELREETGLTITQADLAFVRTLTRYQQVECVFVCRVRGDAVPQALEISRAAWFAPDALPDQLSEDQRALIRRALPFS